MRYCLMVCMLLFVSISHGATPLAPRDPDTHFFHRHDGNLADALQRALLQGKRGVMLFFEMAQCPFCERMRQVVLNQAAVQDFYREHFLMFTLDVEHDQVITDFSGTAVSQKDFALQRHRVRATPLIAFFDLQGRVVTRYTGAASGPEEFLWLGEYVADGHYLKTRFARFRRDKRQQLD